MEITMIDSSNLHAFANLLPPGFGLNRSVTALGAMIDGASAGTAYLTCAKSSDAAFLEWIFTAPDFRGRGAGRALLEAACNAARKAGKVRLSAAYYPGKALGATDAFYLLNGFELSDEIIRSYVIEREMFEKSDFFSRSVKNDHIIPIERLNKIQKNDYSLKCERAKIPYGESLSLEKYDGGLSMAHIADDQMIDGVILISDAGDGIFDVDWIHVFSVKAMPPLFITTFENAVNQYPDLKRVNFTVNDVSEKLLTKMFSGSKVKETKYRRAMTYIQRRQ